jgi:hypothetical protein
LIDDSRVSIPVDSGGQIIGDYTFASQADVSSPPDSTVGYVQKELYSYMSYSGADAVATLLIPPIGQNGSTQDDGEIITLGELQTISYSIHRENTPIRILGRVNPKSFIKGSRTIAGSLIFTVFNEYAFYKIKKYRELLGKQNGFFAPLADMLPPFDIILTFSNEYGQMSKMKILGVTIVDEGQTVSIDDLIIEQTYTFMARGIQPLIAMRLPELAGNNIGKEEYDAYNLGISTNIFGDRALDELAFINNIKNRSKFLEVRTQTP